MLALCHKRVGKGGIHTSPSSELVRYWVGRGSNLKRLRLTLFCCWPSGCCPEV